MNNYLDIGGYFTMKKIIGGKLYDTETAIRIGECNNGEMPTSFHYKSETLYQMVTYFSRHSFIHL